MIELWLWEVFLSAPKSGEASYPHLTGGSPFGILMNECSFKKWGMKGDKRELIREAAIRVFSEKGFHQARADEIAQAAGVAVGTIYNYFKSKEEILLDIFAMEFEERKRFYERLRESGLPVVEQIREILQEHFRLLEERRELMHVMLRERFEPSKELKAKLARLYRRMVGYIEELLRQGVAEGWIRECDPRVIAHALFGAVEAVIACGLIYPQSEAEEIFRAAPKELAEFIWSGLKRESEG
jgi:TetR/AcrR family fatty acid metabolism transcriptional regulator